MTDPMYSVEEIDKRITFHVEDEIMEVTFQDFEFDNSTDVNVFFDRIEERILETGHELWFFLVNYCNTRIDESAWFAFSRRGQELNLAHSMGSVRFDASETIRRRIENAGARDNFDPNLFLDRNDAVEHLLTLPSKRVKHASSTKRSSFKARDLYWRVEFLADEETMYVDFSDLSFASSADVDLVYDFIEDQLSPLGRKWYFLVNYNGTRIQSPAWVRYSARGKELNNTWSLGSVRFATDPETETSMRLRSESQGFRPNIRSTIEEARERIKELKAEAEN